MTTKNWLQQHVFSSIRITLLEFSNTFQANTITTDFENVFGFCDKNVVEWMCSSGFFIPPPESFPNLGSKTKNH